MTDALRFHHFRTGSVLALIAGERTMVSSKKKRFHLEGCLSNPREILPINSSMLFN